MTGLDWTGRDWDGMDWSGLDLDWSGLVIHSPSFFIAPSLTPGTGLDWTGLGWSFFFLCLSLPDSRLARWAGLGWAGPGLVCLSLSCLPRGVAEWSGVEWRLPVTPSLTLASPYLFVVVFRSLCSFCYYYCSFVIDNVDGCFLFVVVDPVVVVAFSCACPLSFDVASVAVVIMMNV